MFAKAINSIASGNFSDSAYQDLLFYDASTKDIELYSTDGNGILNTISTTLKDRRKTWSTIAPSNFSDSAYSDLPFYEGFTGELAALSTDGKLHFSDITSLRSIEKKLWQVVVVLNQLNSASSSRLLTYTRYEG